MIVCELSTVQLKELLIKQLSNFFYIDEHEKKLIDEYFPLVWSRTDTCFHGITNKYFISGEERIFNPYHSGQYLIYLYFFSNVCSMHQAKSLADKLYYLNKIMHSCDIYHEVELPEVFFMEHPVGTVLGRAQYGNNFFAMQGCTIGGNKGAYPQLGNNVQLFSGAKILGKSVVGDNVLVSASTYVKDTNIPSNSMVFGSSPHLIIKNYDPKR